MSKKSVLAIVSNYPQLSQTYKENEFKYLANLCELFIASTSKPNTRYTPNQLYYNTDTAGKLQKLIKQIQPDVIHGHYLFTLPTVAQAAAIAGDVPFTLRSHSFDILNKSTEQLAQFSQFVRRDNCTGVLVFPFLIARLVAAGYPESKLIPAYPVIDYQRFIDHSANGHKVINTGACMPKKAMHEYVDLAAKMPERSFELVPIGYRSEQLAAYNREAGEPVTMLPSVAPHQMPPLYKSAEWLVYTADRTLATVGWPMAIAEAQASGCGILMQNIRPDLADYLGGAGFTFNSLEEAVEIIRQPYPAAMRERGFEVAKRSDIANNVQQLTALWQG